MNLRVEAIPSKDILLRKAVHEAGHALMAVYHGRPLWDVNITDMVLLYKQEEIYGGFSTTVKSCLQDVEILYGGFVAESIYYGGLDEVSTGAISDISAAEWIIKYICSNGLDPKLDYFITSEKEENLLPRVKELSEECYNFTLQKISCFKYILDRIINELLKNGVVPSSLLQGLWDEKIKVVGGK